MYTQHCKRIFLWSTDSKRIAFGYSPNIRQTNECYSLRLAYTSTSTFLSFPHISFSISVQMWTWLNTNSSVQNLSKLKTNGAICIEICTNYTGTLQFDFHIYSKAASKWCIQKLDRRVTTGEVPSSIKIIFIILKLPATLK